MKALPGESPGFLRDGLIALRRPLGRQFPGNLPLKASQRGIHPGKAASIPGVNPVQCTCLAVKFEGYPGTFWERPF